MTCKNVLIIDDELDIRLAVQNILEAEGYQVFQAANGKEGADLLRKMASIPCVILLDLMMPKMNGWEFLDMQRVDPVLKEIPVIICSAFTESAKTIKAQGFLKKPVELDDLLGVVKAFCA